jgi:hypothetical protein
MSKAIVTGARRAGPDHAVLDVEGGATLYRREPCGGCPWRIDQVGQFPAEAFRHSANTAYDSSDRAFGCHETGRDRPAMCAGFLLHGAEHNLLVRLRTASGQIDLAKVSASMPLHGSYRAMAVANGVPEDDPALRRCRP